MLRGFVFPMAHMCTPGHQFSPESLPFPFVEPEDDSVSSAIGVNIFQSKSVVLLVTARPPPYGGAALPKVIGKAHSYRKEVSSGANS